MAKTTKEQLDQLGDALIDVSKVMLPDEDPLAMILLVSEDGMIHMATRLKPESSIKVLQETIEDIRQFPHGSRVK